MWVVSLLWVGRYSASITPFLMPFFPLEALDMRPLMLKHVELAKRLECF